jgi:hypothetical protein
MKRMSILFVIASTLIVGGCADALEQRSTEEVGGQLQRGVTGRGRLAQSSGRLAILLASTACQKLIRST